MTFIRTKQENIVQVINDPRRYAVFEAERLLRRVVTIVREMPAIRQSLMILRVCIIENPSKAG